MALCLARGEEETRPAPQGKGRGAPAARAAALARGTDGKEENGEARVDVHHPRHGEQPKPQRSGGLPARQEAGRQDPDGR